MVAVFISPTYSDNCPQGNISDFMQYFGSSAVIQFIKAIDALLAFYEPNNKLSGKVDLLEKYLQNCLSFRKKSYICSRNELNRKE